MSKPKVLIVDDNAEIRNVLRTTLKNHVDSDVFEAKDGQEAMNLIRLKKPNIVILDIMMPGEIDGLNVCDFIKYSAEFRSIFVVLLTAKDTKEDVFRGMEARANMYLTKPFSPDGLAEIVLNYNKHASS